MTSRTFCLLGAVALLGLAACGEVSFKQGDRDGGSGGAGGGSDDATTASEDIASDGTTGSDAEGSGSHTHDEVDVHTGGAGGGATGDGDLGPDPDARSCGCGGGGYQIDAQVEYRGGEETIVRYESFHRAPAPTLLRSSKCDVYQAPSLIVGGSCLPTQIAGCNAQGACIVIGHGSVTLTRADGSVELTATTALSIGGLTWSREDPEVGSFEFAIDDDVVVSGAFNVCVADIDLCLR